MRLVSYASLPADTPDLLAPLDELTLSHGFITGTREAPLTKPGFSVALQLRALRMAICALAYKGTSKLRTQSLLHVPYTFPSSVCSLIQLDESSEPALLHLYRRPPAPRRVDMSALINSLEACGRTTNLEFRASTGSAAHLMPNVCTEPHTSTLHSLSHLFASQFVRVSFHRLGDQHAGHCVGFRPEVVFQRQCFIYWASTTPSQGRYDRTGDVWGDSGVRQA